MQNKAHHKSTWQYIVKDMDIATGGTPVVLLNEKDAQRLDLHHMDRVMVCKGRKKVVAVLDIGESGKAVQEGHIGVFEEALDALSAVHNDKVVISLASKPESILLIKRKLDGGSLTYDNYLTIMKDIANDRLTTIELSAFVLANYSNPLGDREIADLTRAMRDTGEVLKWKPDHKIIADLHSIGGVPGNRTTILVVPILIAAGLFVPKTSSRAITSPAGTADTMEVLCNVSLPLTRLKQIIRKVGGFIAWGGAVNLSPADDKIIHVERPLSIDAEGQMLASIMSKKASVGATHLLIEIPLGPGSKVKDRAHAKHLERHFQSLGKLLGIKTCVMIEDGSQPIGNGIGPILEMQDCLRALMNLPGAPSDLVEKSLKMAATLLEFAGKSSRGKGYATAQELLKNGAAFSAFEKMVIAQGGKILHPDNLTPGKYTYTFLAGKSGEVKHIDNLIIARIARLAGAPLDKGAGIFLNVRCGQKIRKGQSLFTIYAESPGNLTFAKDALKNQSPVIIR